MRTWTGPGDFASALESARAGDDSAFAALWRWLHPPLLRWLRVVDPVQVDDIASEVWLAVARNLGTFEGDEQAFRGWVFTIARRRSIDAARLRRRQPQFGRLDDIDVADPTEAESTLAVDAAAALEAALTLLHHLTPDQREVVALRVIVGMTVQETAAVVGKSEGAVRVLCHRGLRALAALLDASVPDEVVA